MKVDLAQEYIYRLKSPQKRAYAEQVVHQVARAKKQKKPVHYLTGNYSKQ